MIKLFQIWTMLFFVFFPIAAQRSDFDVAKFDRARVLKAANQYLSEKPITITASHSPRSAGGLQDFFSESDSWTLHRARDRHNRYDSFGGSRQGHRSVGRLRRNDSKGARRDQGVVHGLLALDDHEPERNR